MPTNWPFCPLLRCKNSYMLTCTPIFRLDSEQKSCVIRVNSFVTLANTKRDVSEFFRNTYLTQKFYYQPFHSNLKAFYYTIKHRHCKALANCNSWPEIGNTSEKGKTIERW